MPSTPRRRTPSGSAVEHAIRWAALDQAQQTLAHER